MTACLASLDSYLSSTVMIVGSDSKIWLIPTTFQESIHGAWCHWPDILLAADCNAQAGTLLGRGRQSCLQRRL